MILRKAVSGVVASLVIIAITIILSAGVIYFYSGLRTASPEELDIRIISICTDKIDLLIRNKGVSDVKIEEVLVVQRGEVLAMLASDIELSPGQSKRIVAPSGESGDTCQIVVVTSGGNTYVAEVQVP